MSYFKFNNQIYETYYQKQALLSLFNTNQINNIMTRKDN